MSNIYNETEFNEMVINDLFDFIETRPITYIIVSQIVVTSILYGFLVINIPILIGSVILYGHLFTIFESCR